MARRQRTRDSWNVWRGKVNLKLDEYDPATIVAIIEQLELQNEKIGILREDMNSVKSNIVTLNGQMTEALSSIGALQTRVGTNEGNIATLQSSMLEAQGNIAALGGRMTTAEGNISSLQTAMGTAQSDITQAKSDIVSLQSDVANLKGRMTTAEGNITGLRTDVDANAASIRTAQGNITTLQSDMTTAKSDISGLTTRMSAVETKATTNETNITNLTTRMGTAENNISTNSGDIDTLESGLSTANTNIADITAKALKYSWVEGVPMNSISLFSILGDRTGYPAGYVYCFKAGQLNNGGSQRLDYGLGIGQYADVEICIYDHWYIAIRITTQDPGFIAAYASPTDTHVTFVKLMYNSRSSYTFNKA